MLHGSPYGLHVGRGGGVGIAYALGHVAQLGLLTAHDVYAYALYACFAAATTQIGAVCEAADASLFLLFCHNCILFFMFLYVVVC